MRFIIFLRCQVLTQYKLFILLIQALVLSTTVIAGFEQPLQLTAVFSKASAGIASSSFDQIVLNPASGGTLSSSRFSLFYAPSPFHLSQLSQYGFITGHPVLNTIVAIGAQLSGFSLYREALGMLTLSGNIYKDFVCGISTRIFHVSILHYGSAVTIGIDLGAIIQISEIVSVGISVMNVNGADVGADDDIPRSVGTGISLRPISEVTLCADIVKDLRYAEAFRVSIEMTPIETLTLSAGVQSDPSRMFGGIGISMKPFTIHYGVGTHTDLGLSHSIGITFYP